MVRGKEVEQIEISTMEHDCAQDSFSRAEPTSDLTLTRSFGSLPIFQTGKLTTTNA